MKRLVPLSALVTLISPTVEAAESYNIPTSLDGKKIHFSYSPAYKFTPLIMHCGAPVNGTENCYHLESDNRKYTMTYTPNTKGKTGKIHINGGKNKADIQLKFDNETCGTAHMTWNNIKYYHLKFRIQDTAPGASSIQRMGDAVGDVIPQSLADKVVEINFKGAVERIITQDAGEETASGWHDSYATPFVFQFPANGNSFEIPHFMPHSEDNPYPPMKVSYELIGTGATITINGRSHLVEAELDFEDSTSGLAHVLLGYEEGFGFQFNGATFTIQEAEGNGSKVIYPENIDLTESGNTEVKQMIQDLSLVRYETAVEKLYQKRLLTGLNALLYGADINHILPNANGTTLLHNACGLSHVEIVQWLVNHGADLTAKTAKGASVDDCVGGPNAAAIRRILNTAKRPAN